MRKKEERLEKQMNEVMTENRRLIEPLQKAKDEVQELQKQVGAVFKHMCSSLNILCYIVLLRDEIHLEKHVGVYLLVYFFIRRW